MASGREPLQVAKRTLVLGAIAFRASLEVTNHPRTVELSRRMLPWLREVNCDDEIDPIERDLLDTPLGCLGPSLRIDANYAGEAAAYFCWALGMAEPLPVVEAADQAQLLERLAILTPGAATILQSPSLRDRDEIRDASRHYVLVRSRLQEIRVGPPASDIIRRGHFESLHEVGIEVPEEAVERATAAVDRMTPEERSRSAALYFVRSHAALWLFSDRPTYFE